ncbi:hypothetical protein GCM10010326_05400 [Streptomyces xanthochromogenes]|uniref:Uncharacterized protein n=1 Tax=Streptomyces xanthochromogenes TaxID=67384 RepID=A0ABQ2ZKX1_9ACTN|nr:hypothetical protein GCM10010326_05400 [Streptomyces xanthochromogenes]
MGLSRARPQPLGALDATALPEILKPRSEILRGEPCRPRENRWITAAVLHYLAAEPSPPGKDVPLYTV